MIAPNCRNRRFGTLSASASNPGSASPRAINSRVLGSDIRIEPGPDRDERGLHRLAVGSGRRPRRSETPTSRSSANRLGDPLQRGSRRESSRPAGSPGCAVVFPIREAAEGLLVRFAGAWAPLTSANGAISSHRDRIASPSMRREVSIDAVWSNIATARPHGVGMSIRAATFETFDLRTALQIPNRGSWFENDCFSMLMGSRNSHGVVESAVRVDPHS